MTGCAAGSRIEIIRHAPALPINGGPIGQPEPDNA